MSFLKRISEIYNIDFERVELYSESGYRNKNIKLISNNKTFNFVIYKNDIQDIQRIDAINSFSNHLSNLKFPTRKTIKTAKGESVIKVAFKNKNYLACLYNYLDGHTIPWEEWNRKHLTLLGQFMATMHIEAQEYKKEGLRLQKKIINKLIERQEDYFERYGIADAINSKLGVSLNKKKIDKLFKLVGELDEKDETILHMDLVRGNVLFKEENNNVKLSGVIDFEKVAIGSIEYDLARTFAFLLVDCKFKAPKEIENYFLKSYLKIYKNKIDKKKFQILVNFFLLFDMYKFLIYTPFEALNNNEHFIRTKNLLISTGMLTS